MKPKSILPTAAGEPVAFGPLAPALARAGSGSNSDASPIPRGPLDLNRRRFLGLTALGVASGWQALVPALQAASDPGGWDPKRPFPVLGKALRVQPVFLYKLPVRREATSWKSWGGVQTEPAVAEETARIERELKQISARAEFPLTILPLRKVVSVEEANACREQDYDVTLVYACTGGGEMLRACLGAKPDAIVFVRHRSGPVYYWYEGLSVRIVQPGGGTPALPAPPHVDDVVVDNPGEVLWRLRGLFGRKNLLGTRILALGGPWGKYAADAPEKAKERYGLQIVDVSYEQLAPRLKQARQDPQVQRLAEAWTRRFLALPHTVLQTERRFVVNAFILYRVFKELMQEHDTVAFTIKSCMGTIMPMSETTACLTLGLLNDEGLMAFCESDFVIIPAGMLLRYLCGKPVFLHNSTFPHRKTVTCAHCTCPRRLDGKRYEPVRIVTHYESDYGAAPKVEIPLGQPVTFIDPEYSQARWLGFKGRVRANPFYDICRSQQDVEIEGDWKRLVNEARDSHWMMSYGDYVKEAGYAARKLGLQWVTLEPQG
jgi:hypothetical protein